MCQSPLGSPLPSSSPHSNQSQSKASVDQEEEREESEKEAWASVLLSRVKKDQVYIHPAELLKDMRAHVCVFRV